MNNLVTDAVKSEFPPGVLLVDDDSAILSALQRVLKRTGYRMYVAQSPTDALEILTREDIDAVLSDMRMPVMDGAELLQRVRRNWPNISRVLMTGQSDLEQTIRAINEGGVHHYVSKPWQDDELRTVVEQALERALLYRENERLMTITQSQNARLTELTEKLDARVKDRTHELRETNARLERTNASLKKAYRSTIKVLSSVIQMQPGIAKGVSQQVAEVAYAIAKAGELPKRDRVYIYFSAQLYELGKLALEKELNVADLETLSADQYKAYQQYPLLGELALEGVDYLEDVGRYIATHRENWDGHGYPAGLSGYKIPVGGRILRVACDYVEHVRTLGNLTPKSRPRHAMVHLRTGDGTAYDSEVLNWLERYLERMKRNDALEDEVAIMVRQLMPGMILSRDFYTSHGVLMLAKEHMLSEKNIDHLVDLQRMERADISVWVYT